eukprot:CAMPEP_0171289540 /NCGR_PEP_ID=MMETSP0790-20130122/70658_1 /TAXON_ID=2925 /ORGANISM="Alexandrium catenella, Strain OF101" /LENGTH=236 /DNA_ID=CAMNT_0011759173 /DNA_START=49 /DNA_END=755 /DNA_ORIENTATION=+
MSYARTDAGSGALELAPDGLHDLLEGLEEVRVAVQLNKFALQLLRDAPTLLHRHQVVVARVELHDPTSVLPDGIPDRGRVVARGSLALVPQVGVASGHQHEPPHDRFLGQAHGSLGAARVPHEHGVGAHAQLVEEEGQPDGPLRVVRVWEVPAHHLVKQPLLHQLFGKPTIPVGIPDVGAAVAWSDNATPEAPRGTQLDRLRTALHQIVAGARVKELRWGVLPGVTTVEEGLADLR